MSRPLDLLLSRLNGVRERGPGNWVACCPAHDDHTPSLSIAIGDSGKLLLTCHAGCSYQTIMKAAGIDARAPSSSAPSGKRIVATYDYTDEHSALLYQKVRYVPKDFRTRRPDGNGGWTWKKGDAPPVLYRLPDVRAAIAAGATIFFTEGEKDADRAIQVGLAATTNIEGAAKAGQRAKWRKEYTAQLAGANRVVLLPHNDSPGRAHMQAVAAALVGVVTDVRLLELSGLPDKGDVSDWLNAGHTVDELRRLADAAPQAGTQDSSNNPPYSLLTNDTNPKLQLPSIAAKILAAHYRQLAYDRVAGRWMEYRKTHWNALADDDTFRLLVLAIENGAGNRGFSPTYVNGVRDMMTAYLDSVVADADRDLLPFKNGMLDLRTMQLSPHSRELKNTWSLPFDYDPTATCQPVIDWLLWAVNDDPLQVELLRAYLRAVLTGQSKLQRYLELLGPGGTGKGTFTDLCQSIIGAGNYHATRLKTLHESRFETARLYRKRLLVISDEDRFTDGVSTLKRITGGDDLPFEEKNKQGGNSFKFTGMALVTANEAVTTGDLTSGLQRRRITVRFDRQPAPSERRDLMEEFTPYLPGVVAWALAMPEARMRELLLDTVTHVPNLGRISLETLRQVNPLAAWADDYLVLDAATETQVGSKKRETLSEGDGTGKSRSFTAIVNANVWLYASYCQWCADSGAREIASRRFTDLLKDLLCHQLKLDVAHLERTPGFKDRPSRFKGIRLRRPTDNGIPPFLVKKENKSTANLRQIYGKSTAPMEDSTAPTANSENFHENVGCQQSGCQRSNVDSARGTKSVDFAVGAVDAVETQAESSATANFAVDEGADFAVGAVDAVDSAVAPDDDDGYLAALVADSEREFSQHAAPPPALATAYEFVLTDGRRVTHRVPEPITVSMAAADGRRLYPDQFSHARPIAAPPGDAADRPAATVPPAHSYAQNAREVRS